MYYRDNRTRVDRKEGDYGSVLITEGFISLDKDHYYFRPSRGSGGFALYKTERNAKSSGTESEHPRRVRLVLEFY